MATSILGRAKTRGLFDSRSHQIRDYATGPHRSVDDTAFGGGGGMVLRVDVLANALENVRAKHPATNSKTVYFSPRGKRMEQRWIRELSAIPTQWIFVCGHYEGVDERFIDQFVDLEVSLGDFVLTGGELPALAFADALARHLDGTVSHEAGADTESFSLRDKDGSPLLEYPHYTRPRSFRGQDVPEVLLSGNHKAIEEWRQSQASIVTQHHRPDLLD